jgi:hypothetical protein
MRTIEAMLAFLITFIFLVYIVFKGVDTKPESIDLGVLSELEQRDDFRDCIYANNASCVESLADEFIPDSYDLKVSIGPSSPFKGAKDIYTETLFVVTNSSDNIIVYLYYWPTG